LLDGRRQCLPGIGCFSSRETDQRRTGEGKGCICEYTAKPLEAIVKSTRIMPVLAANIAALGAAAAVEDNT